MEFKQINQLMVAMRRTGIKRMVFKKEGVELELEREDHPSAMMSLDLPYETSEENPLKSDFEKHHRSHSPIATLAETVKHPAKGPSEEKEDTNALPITSPMVGTVYYSPSPNDPAFVKPGDRVEKNTVVCIIEAMKVMNEVKAGVAGIISEPLVENGHPVEFGTKLFRVIP